MRRAAARRAGGAPGARWHGRGTGRRRRAPKRRGGARSPWSRPAPRDQFRARAARPGRPRWPAAAHLVDAVPSGVADVERLDGALVELGDELLRGRRERPAAARLGHDDPELLLAQDERLEEPADPGDGEDLLPGLPACPLTPGD